MEKFTKDLAFLFPVNVFVSDAKIYLLKGKAFSGFAFGREVIIRTKLIDCQMLS